MAHIRPLRALRPHPDQAHRVASVPYDVVDTAEARALAAGNPASFLHVIRPEIDLPETTDIHADEVYAQAAAGLERLGDEGILVRDEQPALYVYRQVMGAHSQVGIVGCCSVDEYDADRIKKHERTREDKENDRTRHVISLSAHAGPVFLTYRDDDAIDAWVEGVMTTSPLYDFTAVDGVVHTVWRSTHCRSVMESFERVESLYVADGHHRSASASRARAVRREANPAHSGEEDYNRFLAVLFPAGQLKILAYNRVVHDLAGLSITEFLARVGEVLSLSESAAPSPGNRGAFSMYLSGRWYGLDAPPALLEAPDPVASLDAAILQDRVLGPILGIDDPRTSLRVDFVGGIRGTQELEKRVDARPGSVAFSLYPLSVEQLMGVADAGRVLPPKSTWFEPKLRSGLVVHSF